MSGRRAPRASTASREGTAEHHAPAGGWQSDWGLAAHSFLFTITRSLAKARRASVGLYLWGGESRVRKVGGGGRREERVRVVEREQARGGPPLGRGAGERARVLDHGAWDRQRLVVAARGPFRGVRAHVARFQLGVAARGVVESPRNINQLAVVAHPFCRERHSAGRPSGRDTRSSVRVPGILEPLARDRELLLRERAARSKRGQQEGRERGRRAGRGGAAARRRAGARRVRWPAARLEARRGCFPASSPPRARA